MAAARFERFKNHQGKWQWRCLSFWSYCDTRFTYYPAIGIAANIPGIGFLAKLYLTVKRKPPLGFCARPHKYL